MADVANLLYLALNAGEIDQISYAASKVNPSTMQTMRLLSTLVAMLAGVGVLILVYIIAILAAVALPAYQDYTVKAKLSVAIVDSQNARDALANYYQSNQTVPES